MVQTEDPEPSKQTAMYQPLTLFVGLRYPRAKQHYHFISFISLISMAGIALGVITLLTAISIMKGFERELPERIPGMILPRGCLK